MAGPLIGRGAGYVAGKVLNRLAGTSAAARAVNPLLDAAGYTPETAQDALTRLGPNATLVDVNPAITTEAGALAARGGSTTSTIKTAMQAWSAAADGTASRLMEQHLGPSPT